MNKIICGACKSPDIRMSFPAEIDRPLFTCAGCGSQFTKGLDGGPIAIYCRGREACRKGHEPHYVEVK